MKHPTFYVDEEVRVGRGAYDRRLIGAQCTVKRLMKPIAGEHRYIVETVTGITSVVLESTLQKVKIPWSECVFQPKRATHRPTGWKEFK